MPANPKATKHYADLVIAARKLGEDLIDDGTFDPDQLRYSIVARDDRKRIVPLLKAEGFSNRQIARKLGVAEGTIRNDLDAQNSALSAQNYAADAKAAKRAENQARRAEEQTIPADFPALNERYQLVLGDLSSVEIEPESIDCIITDPPYAEQFVALYETLAERAALWLKPGGSLLAMAGQTYLPQVLAALAREPALSYHWTIAYLTPGGQSVQIFPRKVNTFWKPVLWFVKGAYQRDWIGDVAKSDVNDNDKRFHDWGQSESGLADLVRRFSKVGDRLCDPFLGGGTTGTVAVSLGRYFIGVEKDQAAFRTAKTRFESLHAILVA